MSGSIGVRLDGLKARRIAGGLSVTQLAQLSNVSEWQITKLEEGGNCLMGEAEQIINGLAPPGVLLGTSPQDVTVFCLLLDNHRFVTGDTVVISGTTGFSPDINGSWVITSAPPNSFIIPLDMTGGELGSTVPNARARLSDVSVGLTRL